MSERISEPYPLDDRDKEDDYRDEEESGDCTLCGGEGEDECDDPLQCTKPHTHDGYCTCRYDGAIEHRESERKR